MISRIGAFIAAIFGYSVLGSKYGLEFVVEAFLAILALIIMIHDGNSYVFTQKREKFKKSVLLGFPILLFACLHLVISITEIKNFNLSNFLNLILYTFSIGVFEEFIFRGWILNEFLENYGDSRKKVFISILLSSLIFGLIHFDNVLVVQELIYTIFQILNATAMGFLLGTIYFRTKNIWSVIFLHAFWDFSILLSEVGLIKDCTMQITTNAVLIYYIYGIIITMLLWFIFSLILFKGSKVNKLINPNYEITEEEKNKEKKSMRILYICFISIVIINFIPINEDKIDGYAESRICYSFEEKKLESITTHYPYSDKFFVEYNSYKFELFTEDGEITFKNANTNDNIYFKDYFISDYELIDYENYFVIILYDNDNQKVYYQKIDKSMLSNNDILKQIESSFKIFNVPKIEMMGYLTDEQNKYPLLKSALDELFIIDENDNVFLVK